MRKLKGSVKCESAKELIEPGSVASVEIRDTDVREFEARPMLVGQTKLNEITGFPFEFSLDFDDTIVQNKPKTIFSISVRVHGPDGRLVYQNEPELDIRNTNGCIQENVKIVVQKV